MGVSMIKLKPDVKTYVQQLCPQGITLHKNNKSFYVKQSKTVNGRPTVLTKVINVNVEQGMSDADVKEAFENALPEAVNVKRQFKQRLNNPNIAFHRPTAVGVGTLSSVFNMMFVSQWGQASKKQQYLVKHFYADLELFFGADKRLSDITEEDLEGMANEATGVLEDGFKQWCARKIAEREKNMTGTVASSSINKRLGVLRSILRFALKKRLLSNEQLINPDPRVKNMGVVDLPRGESKRKPAFTDQEQEQFLMVVQQNDSQYWYDLWAWAFDCGMRHEGELDNFNIDNIDFGRKTVTFWRSKTDGWSVEMPLTNRMLEIAKRRRKEAINNPGRKVFPGSASSRRCNWDKHIKSCNFNKHFTPYTTRHTFITRLAEANVNPKVAMELAGHSVIETTMTYYTKSSNKLLVNAMKALENTRPDLQETDDSTVELSNMIGHNSRKALK
jgi:integrase